jgi:nucleoside-diphosphate-sugar epimerase
MTQTPSSRRTALVIGATGSFGAHAAQALVRHGWTVRAMSRNPEAAAKSHPKSAIEWVRGDVMDPAETRAAAKGVDLIVHAANPPRYHNWKGTILPMIESVIGAALASGARLMIPGSIYNYAPQLGAAIAEDAPQAPTTRKGAIRVEVERRLRNAASGRGLKVLILRAGDFFGPDAPNSALSWLVNRRGNRMTGVYQPGPSAVGHAFAYLPDLAETLARLMDAEDRMGAYESFHFRGHWIERNDQLGAAVRQVSRNPRLPIRAFPWAVVFAASPFNEMFRELWEMRYLWRRPIGLANGKLIAFLGEEPHTPLDSALKASLADMGLLDEPSADQRSGLLQTVAI